MEKFGKMSLTGKKIKMVDFGNFDDFGRIQVLRDRKSPLLASAVILGHFLHYQSMSYYYST